MPKKEISSGVVHKLPADLKKALASDPQALAAWEDITPVARNEWICWIESAKKAGTRSRRIEWAVQVLRMENDGLVVGPDARTANSISVKLNIATADWRRLISGLPVFLE
jgi:hypothetical protein